METENVYKADVNAKINSLESIALKNLVPSTAMEMASVNREHAFAKMDF
jgi:hypothetical protein